MSKHTDGPWIASAPAMGFSDIRQKSTRKLVFAVAHPSTKHGEGEISDEEKYANLALLAAAPEMYEALGNLVKQIRTYGATSDGMFAVLNRAESAIAKATLSTNSSPARS